MIKFSILIKSTEIFKEFIDECLMDIVLEVHRQEKIANTNCQICQTKYFFFLF